MRKNSLPRYSRQRAGPASDGSSSQKAKGGSTLDEKGGIKSYDIVSEEISEDGTTATVTANIKFGNGDEDKDYKIKMIKDDKGDWKISSGK